MLKPQFLVIRGDMSELPTTDKDFKDAFDSVKASHTPDDSLDRSIGNLSYIVKWKRPVDGEAIRDKCLFLKGYLDDNEFFSKPQAIRVAVYNILSAIDSGREYLHSMVARLPGYEPWQVDADVDMLAGAYHGGVIKCESVNRLGDFKGGCKACPSYRKVTCPVNLRGEHNIETEISGFRGLTKDGKPGPVEYEDLIKFFDKRHPYFTQEESRLIYIYRDKYWQGLANSRVEAFAYDNVEPKCGTSVSGEFFKRIKLTNLKSLEWFGGSTDHLINLRNGIYDIINDQMIDHSDEYAFRYILPYEYEPGAECPNFLQFMDDITQGDMGLQEVLIEFMGYCLAGGGCYAEKALILYGDGSNGKSKFTDIIKALAGDKNYSSLSLTALNNANKRHLIDGALFNIGDETNMRALSDSEIFKTMVTGGELDIRKLYTDAYIVKNKCKLIIACNELPKSKDRTFGLYRRMVIAPFKAKFDGKNKDPLILNKMVPGELPGIFNLAVQGYKRLVENNYQFSESDTVTRELEQYQIENDNILEFFTEMVEDTGENEDYIFKDDLFLSYQDYCSETGNFPLAKNVFGKSIKGMVKRYKESKRVRGAKSKWVIIGIKMRIG